MLYSYKTYYLPEKNKKFGVSYFEADTRLDFLEKLNSWNESGFPWWFYIAYNGSEEEE